MQQPTCTGIRIRSVLDAQKIFYAVQQGLLRMVTRRLDADERMQLRTGCVYAWEERGPHTELTGLGIERFTEGRRWSPSRVRDEFLFYYEKYSPSPDCANPHPPRDWDPLVKQTYSVWVETDKGKRKWHLTAYFTQATVDQLGSIDDIRAVRELEVPDGIFKSTRVNKSRYKNEETRSGESSKSVSASRYAPFPAPTLPHQPESSGQVLMYQPYPNHDASATASVQDPVQLYPMAGASGPGNNNSMKLTLQDSSSYQARFQSYQTFSTSRPHPASSQPHHDFLHHSSRSEPGSSTPADADIRRNPSSIPPSQLESQGIQSTSHISTTGNHLHNNDTVSRERIRSSSLMESQWSANNIGNLAPTPSMYSGNRLDHPAVPTSVSATQPTTYMPQTNISTLPDLQPYRSMPYLTPLHGDTSGASRETLPSLSILQETYSFSCDFSVAMVAQAGPDGTQNTLSAGSSISSPNSFQKSSLQEAELTGSSLCKDLDLAPLNTLSRLHSYRREPVDDRALRRLWPRSC